MIQSYRGLDGYPTYRNVGRASIYGLELEIGKQIGILDINLNYTYLNAMDMDSDQPLDYTPKSRFNIFIDIGEVKGFSLSLWASAVSVSEAKMGKTPPFQVIEIPAYTLFNARLEKKISGVTLYVKGENLFNESYFAEPGFPMKARTISIGCRLDMK
jgi:outer membrane cobalamin receptor